MPAREVLLYPDRQLKQVCAPAQPVDAGRVAEDLVETMSGYERCAGIAAPQVGEMCRIAVVDASANPKVKDSHGLLVLINPVVVEANGSEVAREGCLSLPDLTANVRRATEIRVRYSGGEEVEAHGFEARCILHELDHLDGILFLDRVSSIVDDVFRRQRY